MPQFETLLPSDESAIGTPDEIMARYPDIFNQDPVHMVEVRNTETVTVDNFWEQGWGYRFVVAVAIENRIKDFKGTGLLSEDLEVELQAKFDRFIELNQEMSILQGAVTR
jgi:hypothetical protein